MGNKLGQIAAWLSILAVPLAYANVGLALVAVDFDLSTFSETVLGFRLVASHSNGAELTRWSMLSDMLGFYLMLIPLALVMWNRLKKHGEQLATLFSLFGLGYLFFGAMGAAILSEVLPNQIHAYNQAPAEASQVHEAIFLAFTYAIYDGVWGMLNSFLAGVWWMGMGGLLRQERRLLGWVTIVLGAITLLRVFGPIEMIALSIYFVLAPICMAWIGVDVLVSGSKRQLVSGCA
jgi:hypothetical protein